MDIINYIGIVPIAFIAFIVFCLVKGGNNKGDGNGSNNKSEKSSGGNNESQGCWSKDR